MKKLLAVLFAVCSFALCYAEENAAPYDALNTSLKLFKSQKKDGHDVVPIFVRTSKGDPLDPAKANFHLKSLDGETLTLKCEKLKPSKEFSESTEGKQILEEGYTHVLWIPKDEAKFKGGSMIHELEKGSVQIGRVLNVSGTFTLP